MNRQPVLHGDRLWLRPLRADDWAVLWGIAQDRQIWAMHPAHDRWQEPVFREFFDDALMQGGALAVVDRASGLAIGSSRFQNHDPVRSQVEIGWTFLDRPYWGLGYNAEFKKLMLAHALQYVARVVFSVGADNLISRRAMANIGGHLTDETHRVMRGGKLTEHVTFEITRESFAGQPLTP